MVYCLKFVSLKHPNLLKYTLEEILPPPIGVKTIIENKKSWYILRVNLAW